MDKGQGQTPAAAPMHAQHGIPGLLAGHAQQYHRPHALRPGNGILHDFQPAGLQPGDAQAGLPGCLSLKCRQPPQCLGAHALAPAPQTVLGNEVVEVIACGLYPVTTRQ
ncbi:hypothetical protein SDC9_162302 [bioreactor metagenome]|uniref:Uncharacterized protein n=1 Tax=bioreactor metagenome TaxID=1076179 RepID=A0A645FSB9_9ZZZZ